MKNFKQLLLFPLVFYTIQINSQETENNDYIEFNDRKNIVHGVYLGFNTGYGEIEGEDTGTFGLKIAYVADRKFEIGFSTIAFYSQQNLKGISPSNNEDLIGVYGGFHFEPILFSKRRINLSFPLLIGAGSVGYIDGDFEQDPTFDSSEDNWDTIFVIEPGISILFNISRYVQLEAGVKHRFSSKIELTPASIDRINGFSAGFGVKVGVFNLGRNRYKKSMSN